VSSGGLVKKRDVASTIDVPLSKDCRASPGVVVNGGEHRAKENACQSNTLVDHPSEEDRLLFTNRA
jgi:hypothetical protein